ncbi:MAG TPA: hypothetical protein VI749_05245 [Candidatus Omnitrophota bacterium]|nr:hypothetical protein [Candidatus Omnitrophota bacterium]
MKRIGVAASKISKGNSAVYNALVVLIACLFSFFMFVVIGSTVIFALAVISYVSNEIMPAEHPRNWEQIRVICIVSLAMVISVFNLMAIIINLKLPGKGMPHE